MENSDWYDHVVAGIQYLKTARKGKSRPEVFTNELIYNLVSLSVEKLLVGLSLHFGKMPPHHRLDSLVQWVDKLAPMDEDLVKNVMALDSYQDICSMDAFERHTPNDMEIQTMLEIAKKVELFVKQCIEKRSSDVAKSRKYIHFAKTFV